MIFWSETFYYFLVWTYFKGYFTWREEIIFRTLKEQNFIYPPPKFQTKSKPERKMTLVAGNLAQQRRYFKVKCQLSTTKTTMSTKPTSQTKGQTKKGLPTQPTNCTLENSIIYLHLPEHRDAIT